MASAHHRHQSSLEGVISFSSSPPLDNDERVWATKRFYQIVEHYEKNEITTANGSYNRPKLIRLTYEYATSEKSKDSVLQAFFRAISLQMNDTNDVDFSIKEEEELILTNLAGFADYLINNFFLPLKASTKRTPQPSPAYHSGTQSTRAGSRTFIGASARLKNLRGECLQRDRHRCVISRKFDQKQAIERLKKFGRNAKDDDGNPLADEDETFDSLEVAHILPHSLMKTNSDLELNDSREAALKILNMFDNDIVHLIEGPEIDRPRNALTLTHNLHLLFGDFQVYFEPAGDESNTYRINTFLPPLALNNVLPTTRTLFLTETRVIEPPSPRLLAVHRAIAHILHLSAAGAHIDSILQDMEEQSVQVDGSTPIGPLVQLRVDGWLDGIGV